MEECVISWPPPNSDMYLIRSFVEKVALVLGGRKCSGSISISFISPLSFFFSVKSPFFFIPFYISLRHSVFYDQFHIFIIR